MFVAFVFINCNFVAGRHWQESQSQVQVRPLRPIRQQREGERGEEESPDGRQEHGQGRRILELSAKGLGRQGLHGRAERKGQTGLKGISV